MGKIRKKWTQAEVNDALGLIRSGRSVFSVSKITGIPKTTLLDKLKGRRPLAASSGPATVLTTKEEEELENWILYLSKRGFPVTKTILVHSVAELVKKLRRETPFTEGRPGRRWLEGFFRRHPQISQRVAQNLSKSRALITESALRAWFDEVEKYWKEKDLMNIDGSRIFNCDESAFYLCPKGERVLTKKGDKAVYNYVQNDEKECLTVLFMTNANGDLVPPMIVFAYERLPYSISQSMPSDWVIGKTSSGWMTAESFYEYITHTFEPWLTANNIQRPVILYVDGHSSHVTVPLVEFCVSKGIELVSFIPNATHLIQPLDVALFHTLKSTWRNTINDWCMESDNFQKKIRKKDFGQLLKKAVDKINMPEVMKNGFKKCGLCPFSPDALAQNELLKKTKESPQTQMTPTNAKNIQIAHQSHLEFIEQNIDSELLEDFKEAGKTGVWEGAVDDRSLFLFWQKVAGITRNPSSFPGEEKNEKIDLIVIENDNDCKTIPDENSGFSFDITFQELFNESAEQDVEDLVVVDEQKEPLLSEIHEINNDNCESILKPTNIDTEDVTTAPHVSKESDNKENTNHIPPNVSSPFKQFLFWPKPKTGPEKKRKARIKTPSVATSAEWKAHHDHLEEEKRKHRVEVENRKRMRQEAAAEKKRIAEETKKRKEIERAEKKAQKELEKAEKKTSKTKDVKKRKR
ncbi:uncharacterized protein [Temnothorax longispinosus]